MIMRATNWFKQKFSMTKGVNGSIKLTEPNLIFNLGHDRKYRRNQLFLCKLTLDPSLRIIKSDERYTRAMLP